MSPSANTPPEDEEERKNFTPSYAVPENGILHRWRRRYAGRSAARLPMEQAAAPLSSSPEGFHDIIRVTMRCLPPTLLGTDMPQSATKAIFRVSCKRFDWEHPRWRRLLRPQGVNEESHRHCWQGGITAGYSRIMSEIAESVEFQRYAG